MPTTSRAEPSRRRPLARAAGRGRLGGLVGLVALLLTAVGPAAALGPTTTAGAAPSAVPTATAAPAADAARTPVVLVGVTGLRWDDLGSLTTPALWGLSREGAVGTTVVRSVRPSACPADGWLAVSAGTRAGDLLVPDGTCRALREPAPGGVVPGWVDYTAAAGLSSYEPHLGLLGDTLAAAGVTATGIGPGAAVALADASGRPVGTHTRLPADLADLQTLVDDAVAASGVVVVDAGAVRDPGYAARDRGTAPAPDPDAAEASTDDEPLAPALTPVDAVLDATRGEQVQAIDARVRAVLAGVEASRTDATVLVISLADSSRHPHLQLAAAIGPVALPDDAGTGTATGTAATRYTGALLGSQSTRQDGYLQTTDVTPTVLAALGLTGSAPAGTLVGAPIGTVGGPTSAHARVATLVDADLQSQAVRPLIRPYYLLFVGVNLALYALVTIGINARVLGWVRRGLDRRWPWRRRPAGGPRAEPAGDGPGEPADARGGEPGDETRTPRRTRVAQRVLVTLRAGGIALAAIPVSTFLANLTPWWRAGSPSAALTALVVAWVAAVSAVALLPRWRSWLLGPLGVVAAVTTGVVCVDVATGARLQIAALMGTQPLVAGRFYGFNNTAFALVAAASILLAVAVVNPLVVAGRRRAAALVVVGIGLVMTALDGLPAVGADFGGPPALVPGFAVLALLTAGIRLTWRRALGVLAAGAATVTAFALLDWLRPPDSRTHLGRFVATALDGGLWPVVQRKLSGNLHVLVGSELTLLAIGGLVLVLVVLSRPVRSSVSAADGGDYSWLTSRAPLSRLGVDAPMLRPGLVALAVTLGIGFALNDSGILIPAIGIALAVPLLIATCATWMLGLARGPVRGA